MTVPPPWADLPATGPLLRVPAAAEYLGYSAAGYYQRAREGSFPKPISIGIGMRAVSGVPKPWLDAIIADCAAKGGVS